MRLHEQFPIAKKVKRVIESCETYDQLEASKIYMELFFKMFSTPVKNSSYIEADQSTIKIYSNLLEIWNKRRARFIN